jgi:flagellar protein FlaG
MEINDSSAVNSSVQKTVAELQPKVGQASQAQSLQDQNRSPGSQQGYEAVKSPADPAAVQDAVEKLSEFVETVSNRGLQISVDQDLSQVVLKVVNKDNEETIRQIPTEEVLELMKRMKDLSEEFFGDATGLLVENKV